MNMPQHPMQALLAISARLRPSAGPQPRRVLPEVPADAAYWGCGWFDSSQDLQQGLHLHELACPDELATELPLAFWLQIDAGVREGV